MLVSGIIRRFTSLLKCNSAFRRFWLFALSVEGLTIPGHRTTIPSNVMICAKDLLFVDTASVTNDSGHL